MRNVRKAALGLASATVVAFVAFVALMAAAPAGAHEGPGAITVMGQTQPTPQQVEYTVDIKYALDGDAAAPDTFTVSGTGPAGATVGPVALEATADPGVYHTTVDFPATGLWSMTFTSVVPEAELVDEVTVGAVDSPTTTQPDDGTSDETVVASGSPDATTTTVAEEASKLVESEGSGPPAALIIGLIVAGLLVAGGAFWVLRARRTAT